MSINRVFIIGKLGQDVELKHTPSGKPVANFTMATNDSYKDKAGTMHKSTTWHRIVVWGATADNCAKYLSKGSTAYVEGKLQTRSWDSNEGNKKQVTEIKATIVQFLDSKKEVNGNLKVDTSKDYDDSEYTSEHIPF